MSDESVQSPETTQFGGGPLAGLERAMLRSHAAMQETKRAAATRLDESSASRSAAIAAIASAITLNAGHEPITTVATRVLRAIEQGDVPGVGISTSPEQRTV